MVGQTAWQSILIVLPFLNGLCSAQLSFVNYNEVELIPENVKVGTLFKDFQPYLNNLHGCDPYPAVSADGDISLGAAPEGPDSNGCLNSPGQVYARTATIQGVIGIMYAWYFPKDTFHGPEPPLPVARGNHNPFKRPVSRGHRHSWKYIIVWVDSFIAPAATHLTYFVNDQPITVESWERIRSRPVVSSVFGAVIPRGPYNSLDMQPVLEWDTMPGPAKARLNIYDFPADDGSLHPCPINENNFQKIMHKAMTWR